MSRAPGVPDVPGDGLRQQRAVELRQEVEGQQASNAGQAGNETQTETAPANEQREAGPAGQGDYTVRQGDCIASVAKQTGHWSETLWDEPANAELRQARQDRNVLLPGDRLTVPELRPKQEPGETEMRHRFIRKGEPCWLRMDLTNQGEPIGNEPFVMHIGDQQREGTTTAEGHLEVPIPADAMEARLRIRDTDYTLKIGHLDPLDAGTGIRGRLNKLGYAAGSGRGDDADQRLSDALRRFQEDNDLTVTGEVDDATKDRLRQQHEC